MEWWWLALAVGVVVAAWRWYKEPDPLRMTVERGLTLALLVMVTALLWGRQSGSWLADSVWAAAACAALVLSVMAIRRQRRQRQIQQAQRTIGGIRDRRDG